VTISPSGDVLVIEVPCPSQYPSVNNSVVGSHRSGKKTPGYHDLFNAVHAEGKEALEAGWKMIEHPCRFTLMRFTPDKRVFDAINLAQTECNALTAAGVWADDTLAQDVHLFFCPESDGHDRVVMVITRLPAPVGAIPRKPRPRKTKAVKVPKEGGVVSVLIPANKARGDYALLNGVPIPMADALALIDKRT
jgi:hypothetical protein